MEEVWSTVHNAGRKPTAGDTDSRPAQWRQAPRLGVAWSVCAARLTREPGTQAGNETGRGCFVKSGPFPPQNETKLMLELFFILHFTYLRGK